MLLDFGILRSNPMQFMFGCKNMELKEKGEAKGKRCTASPRGEAEGRRAVRPVKRCAAHMCQGGSTTAQGWDGGGWDAPHGRITRVEGWESDGGLAQGGGAGGAEEHEGRERASAGRMAERREPAARKNGRSQL
jgi:hypothetical protein